jgi:cobalt-zinc-cadmium efflux system protein
MSHNHEHKINNYNRSFAIGVTLNIVFVIIEAAFGIFSNSLALLADAGHNLSDVVGLLLAWGARVLAAKATSDKRTYGFRKATVMASLASAVLLLIALGGIVWEAMGRFGNHNPVEGLTVIIVAAVGVIINILTALLFVKGRKHDLNIRGAFLHMAADAGVSLGVVISGVLIMIWGWLWIDPVISLIIAAVIFISTWRLFLDSINYAVDAVPENIEISKIREYLESFNKVSRIHDLHIWPLSTTQVALTVHLVVNEDSLDNSFLQDLSLHLLSDFGIEHSTIQIESSKNSNDCLLDVSECK